MEIFDKKEFYNNIDKQILLEVRSVICLAVKLGINQENIGDILDVAPATVGAWYTGTLTPSLKHYLALQYLKVVLCLLEKIRNRE